VINLRGKVIPVMDLRERFGLPQPTAADAAEAASQAAVRCIIVAQVRDAQGGALQVGLVVDRVSEVATIRDEDVEEAPSFGHGVSTDYLLGLGKSRTADGHGRVKLLLDIDRVLSSAEMHALAPAAGEDAPAAA
jgi:purine-binding chemotaxis protein CheW